MHIFKIVWFGMPTHLVEQCVALRWHLVGLAKQAASQRAIVSYTTTAE